MVSGRFAHLVPHLVPYSMTPLVTICTPRAEVGRESATHTTSTSHNSPEGEESAGTLPMPIPKPRGEAGRSHPHGYKLKDALGWTDVEYIEIQVGQSYGYVDQFTYVHVR